MGILKDVKLVGATNGSGAKTLTHTSTVYGWLEAIEWIDGDLADGVDAVISLVNTPSGVDRTLLTLTNADNDAWYQVRVAEHGATGTASATTTRIMLNGTPQLVISNGGDTKTGGCVLHYFS